jgi:hypothetical protein
MSIEDLVRQSVRNTLSFVGCTSNSPRYIDGVDTWSWDFKNNRTDAEVFENRVLYHFRAIQFKMAEEERKAKIIPVDMYKLEDSYNNGFATGINWTKNYVPGGPFKFGAGEYESDRHKAIAAQTQGEHDAWMQGWHDGKAAQG